ncbi:MAG TPA: hypothetical protein PKB02_19040 [Anaerohalosphaeraceae bacterium]|nr:hypothetical protein [Anaerohalosphaeraceae bacterium]
MNKGSGKGGYIGEITEGIMRNTHIIKIIGFIYQQLPAWRDDPEREQGQSEPELNPQLCKFLDIQTRSLLPMFAFYHEEPQSSNRHVDLSVAPVEAMDIGVINYTKYNPVLFIECKRLPAPSPDREKEYVTGADPNKKTGGIQRFKLGLHGGKYDIAAMIGYVQTRTFQEWHYQINKWILEFSGTSTTDGCTWTTDEGLTRLEENSLNKVAKYHSTHLRNSKKEIELYHLWIIM